MGVNRKQSFRLQIARVFRVLLPVNHKQFYEEGEECLSVLDLDFPHLRQMHLTDCFVIRFNYF